MTFTSWTRTDPRDKRPGASMDQIVMARAVSPASRQADDEIFHYPDGVALPPSHPGETLADELAARGLTANALALKLRVPANRITDIVRGRRAVTAETALRLGRYFGTGAKLWVDLQASYDLAVAERDLGATIEREIDPA
jgi:addiction module HigA family antidote